MKIKFALKKKKHWLRLIPDESGSKSMAG